MNPTPSLQVAVDVGSRTHYVVIGQRNGSLLDEFTITHSPLGFDQFFQRIEQQERLYALPVAGQPWRRVTTGGLDRWTTKCGGGAIGCTT